MSTKSISGLFLRACCNMGSTLRPVVTGSRTSPPCPRGLGKPQGCLVKGMTPLLVGQVPYWWDKSPTGGMIPLQASLLEPKDLGFHPVSRVKSQLSQNQPHAGSGRCLKASHQPCASRLSHSWLRRRERRQWEEPRVRAEPRRQAARCACGKLGLT